MLTIQYNLVFYFSILLTFFCLRVALHTKLVVFLLKWITRIPATHQRPDT